MRRAAGRFPSPARRRSVRLVGGRRRDGQGFDVLIGDVWLISGQSNMEIPVKHGTGAEETIKTSKDDSCAGPYQGMSLVCAAERRQGPMAGGDA